MRALFARLSCPSQPPWLDAKHLGGAGRGQQQGFALRVPPIMRMAALGGGVGQGREGEHEVLMRPGAEADKRSPALDFGGHTSAGPSCLSTSRGMQDEDTIGESCSSRLVGINTPHKKGPAPRSVFWGHTSAGLPRSNHSGGLNRGEGNYSPNGSQNEDPPERG